MEVVKEELRERWLIKKESKDSLSSEHSIVAVLGIGGNIFLPASIKYFLPYARGQFLASKDVPWYYRTWISFFFFGE